MKFVDVKNNIDDEGLKEAYTDANKNSWTQAELDAYNYAAMRDKTTEAESQQQR